MWYLRAGSIFFKILPRRRSLLSSFYSKCDYYALPSFAQNQNALYKKGALGCSLQSSWHDWCQMEYRPVGLSFAT